MPLRRFDQPPAGQAWICGRCGGVCGAHYLTCPVLRLPPGGSRIWRLDLGVPTPGGSPPG